MGDVSPETRFTAACLGAGIAVATSSTNAEDNIAFETARSVINGIILGGRGWAWLLRFVPAHVQSGVTASIDENRRLEKARICPGEAESRGQYGERAMKNCPFGEGVARQDVAGCCYRHDRRDRRQ
jgi:hypothetical protein